MWEFSRVSASRGRSRGPTSRRHRRRYCRVRAGAAPVCRRRGRRRVRVATSGEYSAAQRGSHDYAWRMGSIASVLQWHCSECALINPTENARCARCGLTRLRSDERASRGRPERASTNAECSGSARQEGGGARRSTTRWRREDSECPREESTTSGESTPPTPPPRTDRLARNPTETSLPVVQRRKSRRTVACR